MLRFHGFKLIKTSICISSLKASVVDLELPFVFDLFRFSVSLYTVLQETVPHNISVLMVQTHHSDQPKYEVYAIHKEISLKHTFDEDPLVVDARYTKGGY